MKDLKRYLVRTIHAVQLEARRRIMGYDLGYCQRCTGCGEDGCCPAEHCDNGPLCPGWYGDRDQRNRLIGERNGWKDCWEHLHAKPCDCGQCLARKAES